MTLNYYCDISPSNHETDLWIDGQSFVFNSTGSWNYLCSYGTWREFRSLYCPDIPETGILMSDQCKKLANELNGLEIINVVHDGIRDILVHMCYFGSYGCLEVS